MGAMQQRRSKSFITKFFSNSVTVVDDWADWHCRQRDARMLSSALFPRFESVYLPAPPYFQRVTLKLQRETVALHSVVRRRRYVIALDRNPCDFRKPAGRIN